MNTIKLNTIGERPIKKGRASGGGGNYVYYSGTTRDFAEGVAMASIIKANMDGDIVFRPSGVFWALDANNENIIGAGFDTSMKMTSWDDSSELITVGDVIAEPSKEWTQITEKEFYGILAENEFRVYYPDMSSVPATTYKFDKGMTWEEWCNSEYNIHGFGVGGTKTRDVPPIVGVIPGHDISSNLMYKDNEGYSYYVYPSEIVESKEYFIRIPE